MVVFSVLIAMISCFWVKFSFAQITKVDIREYHECLYVRERSLKSGAISGHAVVAMKNEVVALPCFDW